MCGIVGYVGHQQAAPVLLEGLARLEYRGYDSAGIALSTQDGELFVQKRAGKIAVLRESLAEGTPPATAGLGHTRWATHGRPNDLNAHPHIDCTGELTVIHNGIIENFIELRAELEAAGHVLDSETDTEAIAHLVEEAYDGDLSAAVRTALQRAHGAYALAVIHKGEPERVVGAKMNVPLIVGLGDGRGLPGLGRGGRAGPYPRGHLPGGGRRRRHPPRLGHHHRHRRTRAGAPGHPHRLGHRGCREGRLRALHAQGDPRAAGGHPRRHRRPHPRGRGAGAGAGPAAADPALHRTHRAHRLRLGRLRSRGGRHRPAGLDRHPGALERGLRVPLRPATAGPEDAGHRGHPVRRDGGHAGAHPPRAREGLPGRGRDQHRRLGHHPRGRCRALPAGRA